ncbi:hypothetical protein L6452_41028 [Arctium lappa]|uniref:Uncharacterized protein n=1 Tax=Arctium lappa TaxID=4217 RepID=A0ACB8XNH7_ARCLA|nr:hypothetical protein L6452_41028 [Arctium lappa]
MSCRAFLTRPPSTMMEGITLVAVASTMEVIVLDVGEKYMRLISELDLVQWYQREEVDASEIVVVVDDDGAVVPWMWFASFVFLSGDGWRETLFCRMAYQAGP